MHPSNSALAEHPTRIGLDSSDDPIVQPPEQRGPAAVWLLLAMLLAGHFLFVLAFFQPAISTPDASGYFKQARLIATEGRTWFSTESDLQYIPPHWLADPSGRYFSKYPPGLPLLAAGVYRLAGPSAALLINPVLATLTLLGLYLAGRSWLGAGWALTATVLMAMNPAVNEQALWAFSHTAVAFFLVWALVFLMRWSRTGGPGWAFVAGILLGAIPTIRYAELLLGLGFVLFFFVHDRGRHRRASSLVALAAGAAIPGLGLAVRNQVTYGAFWRTGYASTQEQTGFGVTYFLEHALPYVNQLLSEGVGPLFGLSVVGLALLCADRRTRSFGLLLVALILPTTILYMAYYFPPDGASMRFLVPTLFVYPLAAVWCLRCLQSSFPRPARIAAWAALGATALWGLPASVQSMMPQRVTNGMLVRAGEAVQRWTLEGSILVSDASAGQYLDYLGRWRIVDGSLLYGARGVPPRGEEAGAESDPRPFSPGASATERYVGLGEAELAEQVARDVWQWAGDARRVFVLLEESAYTKLSERLAPGQSLEPLDSIAPPPGLERRPRRGGMGPPGGPMPGGARPGDGPGGFGPGPGPMPGMPSAVNRGPLILAEWIRR